MVELQVSCFQKPSTANMLKNPMRPITGDFCLLALPKSIAQLGIKLGRVGFNPGFAESLAPVFTSSSGLGFRVQGLGERWSIVRTARSFVGFPLLESCAIMALLFDPVGSIPERLAIRLSSPRFSGSVMTLYKS